MDSQPEWGELSTSLQLTSQLVDQWEHAKLRVDEMWPGLFQGGIPTNDAVLSRLHELGIQKVVSTSLEDPTAWLVAALPGVAVTRLPFVDGFKTPPPLRQIALEAIEIANAVEAGKRVYVHCAYGLNRSSLVTAYALHLLTGWEGERIIAWMRQKRPEVLHNVQFLDIIERFQEVRTGDQEHATG